MVPQYSFSRRPDATASCQVFTNILPIFPFVCSLCSTVTVAILLLKRVEFLNMFLGGNTPLKRTRSSRPANITIEKHQIDRKTTRLQGVIFSIAVD